ncbi:hypothetical protein CSOJ01_15714 [Colletotrichum sojae]|uniref:Uncharacterized protein n=1 Tax=Colletotrichum sojae TaxID=2175907 RepID=A0A8H6MH00_9PEZI|nr:hypothetical protein CSOJ01_15714 [Colletotrichum sojae]
MAAPHRRRIVLSNVPLKSGESGKTEPAVEVITDDLKVEELFEGALRRVTVGTLPSVPASNEGTGLPSFDSAPGSGIVLPGGVNVYFLELAPGAATPMHRTVSSDYVVVNEGTPTLITPKSSFSVADGKGNWDGVDETVLNPGDTAVQRGSMHAWSNKTDKWVRMLAVVVDAKPAKVTVNSKTEELGESWLQTA